MVKIARVVPEISSRRDGQTDTQTDILITVFRNRSRGQSNKCTATAAYTPADDWR